MRAAAVKAAQISGKIAVGADHRPVNRLRPIPQIHAQPLWAAHRRQQIHVGVQIDGLNQHLARQTLGRVPVQRNHALPERMLGVQAQRQSFSQSST